MDLIGETQNHDSRLSTRNFFHYFPQLGCLTKKSNQISMIMK